MKHPCKEETQVMAGHPSFFTRHLDPEKDILLDRAGNANDPGNHTFKKEAFDYKDIRATTAGVVMNEVHHHTVTIPAKAQPNKP